MSIARWEAAALPRNGLMPEVTVASKSFPAPEAELRICTAPAPPTYGANSEITFRMLAEEWERHSSAGPSAGMAEAAGAGFLDAARTFRSRRARNGKSAWAGNSASIARRKRAGSTRSTSSVTRFKAVKYRIKARTRALPRAWPISRAALPSSRSKRLSSIPRRAFLFLAIPKDLSFLSQNRPRCKIVT